MSKTKKKESNDFKAKNAVYWQNEFKKVFEEETDRGAAIYAASLLDIALETLLKTYFVPKNSNKDELFGDFHSPLSDFHTKILITYRIGLISQKLFSDLLIIKRIRNRFAHTIKQSTFDDDETKLEVEKLAEHSHFREIVKVADTRVLFLNKISWILCYLNEQKEKTKPLKECDEEF